MKYLSFLKKPPCILIAQIIWVFCFSPIHCTQELPLVIVTCSYNNAPWVQQNLDSVFMQRYENFRVIYVDDCSEDGTADLVEQYIQNHDVKDKITLIKNDTRTMKGENIYKVFHSCADEEIIVVLDGDDWFSHDKALTNINDAYQKTGAWFAYSQVEYYPQGTIGEGKKLPSSIMEQRIFRKYEWVYKSPRSFYAWLYKLVKLEDQINRAVPLYEGKFYPNCNDRAMVYPMLEMAKDRIVFVPEVAMIQNCYNPMSSQNIDTKPLGPTPTQQQCWKETVKRPIAYDHITEPVLNRLAKYEHAQADCLVLIENPDNCKQVIKAVHQQVQAIGTIVVVCENPEKIILSLQESDFDTTNLKLIQTAQVDINTQCTNEHVLVVTDTSKIQSDINCREIIQQLERTYAYAWYDQISTSLCEGYQVPTQHIEDNMYIWKFACDRNHRLAIHTCNLALYRKQDIALSLSATTMDELKKNWIATKVNDNKIGLFYDDN